MISVLGSGVVGLCVATALHEAGHEIEVIAPEHSPPPASWLAGGCLRPIARAKAPPR